VRNKRKIQEDEHIDIEVIEPEDCWDITARNPEQEYALWLLNNKDIQLVALSGIAGSGKSLMILASALKQTVDKGLYKKIIIIRPTVTVGKDLGFLPGNLEEKYDPWTQAVRDAISVIMAGEDATKTQYLFDSGIIEFAPMAFIRGRTFNNAFLYYDECQNISIHELKSSVTRAGYKSKVVVAGDWDQVDNFRIDKYSCGLAHVIQAFKGQKIFGHCNMVTSERSELAGLAAKLL
jgi:PhoH-like ATPase